MLLLATGPIASNTRKTGAARDARISGNLLRRARNCLLQVGGSALEAGVCAGRGRLGEQGSPRAQDDEDDMTDLHGDAVHWTFTGNCTKAATFSPLTMPMTCATSGAISLAGVQVQPDALLVPMAATVAVALT